MWECGILFFGLLSNGIWALGCQLSVLSTPPQAIHCRVSHCLAVGDEACVGVIEITRLRMRDRPRFDSRRVAYYFVTQFPPGDWSTKSIYLGMKASFSSSDPRGSEDWLSILLICCVGTLTTTVTIALPHLTSSAELSASPKVFKHPVAPAQDTRPMACYPFALPEWQSRKGRLHGLRSLCFSPQTSVVWSHAKCSSTQKMWTRSSSS